MKKNNIIIEAATHGHKHIVNFLLTTFGDDVNFENSNGSTPLMCAAVHGHLDVLKLLITYGADVNFENSNGSTPLMCAVAHGHENVVDFLIMAGADVNHVTKYGYTPLICAATHGHLDVLKLLITAGGNVNFENSNGSTPLMLAVKNGNKYIVQCLVIAGADVNHVNKHGYTPLMCADKKDKIIIKILKFKNSLLLQQLKISFLQEVKRNDDFLLWIKSITDLFSHVEKVFEKEHFGLDLFIYFKKYFINDLKFDDEKYSMLHLVVLNYSKNLNILDEKNLEKFRNLVNNLVNNWLIDINYKDTIGWSAWNYACMLLQKENALIIKKHSQLTDEEREFLKNTLSLKSKKNWDLVEKEEINQIASQNRKDILEYYKCELEDVVSSINDDKNLPIETWPITNHGMVHSTNS